MRLMKYCIIIVVAGLSFLLAIPLSKSPTPPTAHITHIHLEAKQAVNKAALARDINVPTKSSVTPTSVSVSTPVEAAPTPVITATYTCTKYASLFNQYSWNAQTAMAICQAESSGIASQISDPNINFDHIPDYGLMQLHGIDILDPAANISFAYYHKYLTQGWGAWSTYNSGKYQQFL